MKTSSPTDLVIGFSAECSLVTDLKAGLNDTSEAFAQVKVYVLLDGTAVPVSSDDTGADSGKVVYCERTFKVKTYFAPGACITDALCIELFLKTRDANHFNWITLNVGSGEHTIEVRGLLTVTASGGGSAQALVGKRTLIVSPEKLANDITVAP